MKGFLRNRQHAPLGFLYAHPCREGRPSRTQVPAAAAPAANHRGIHLFRRTHRNPDRPITILCQRQPDLHALDRAGQPRNGIQIIHRRARAVKIGPMQKRKTVFKKKHLWIILIILPRERGFIKMKSRYLRKKDAGLRGGPSGGPRAWGFVYKKFTPAS